MANNESFQAMSPSTISNRASAVALSTLTLLFANVACTDSLCTDEKLNSYAYPDSRVGLRAEVHLTNCGATAPFKTSIRIFNKGSAEGTDIFVVRGRRQLRVEWKEVPSEILIYHPADVSPAEVFTQTVKFNMNTIRYIAVPE